MGKRVAARARTKAEVRGGATERAGANLAGHRRAAALGAKKCKKAGMQDIWD